jgi:hypothetical protein
VELTLFALDQIPVAASQDIKVAAQVRMIAPFLNVYKNATMVASVVRLIRVNVLRAGLTPIARHLYVQPRVLMEAIALLLTNAAVLINGVVLIVVFLCARRPARIKVIALPRTLVLALHNTSIMIALYRFAIRGSLLLTWTRTLRSIYTHHRIR